MYDQAMDDTTMMAARTKHAAALFRAELGRVYQAGVASPVECANAMMQTAVITAFVAAEGGTVEYPDAVNACIAEVTQVINRHVTEFVRWKEGGAE